MVRYINKCEEKWWIHYLSKACEGAQSQVKQAGVKALVGVEGHCESQVWGAAAAAASNPLAPSHSPYSPAESHAMEGGGTQQLA